VVLFTVQIYLLFIPELKGVKSCSERLREFDSGRSIIRRVVVETLRTRYMRVEASEDVVVPAGAAE
jgi:hypothetical protein